jgi:hypothetical protein
VSGLALNVAVGAAAGGGGGGGGGGAAFFLHPPSTITLARSTTKNIHFILLCFTSVLPYVANKT